MSKHHTYLKRAMELALLGRGLTQSNPLVGCVIVKNDKIISEGHHEFFGGPHAEVNAIHNASESVEGATLYCTLEPCCHHHKKTPPCTDLIIQHKIKKVIVCDLDPNPQVNGRGITQLKNNGIQVEFDILKDLAQAMNPYFYYYMKNNKPYISLKLATSLDGKFALKNGVSQWITGENSRERVQQIRLNHQAILVGANTLLKDNPSLTIRDLDITQHSKFQQPHVMVLSNGPLDLSKFKFYRVRPKEKIHLLSPASAQDLAKTIFTCAQKNSIHSILVEGGAKTFGTLFEQDIWNEIYHFIAPKILGAGMSLEKPNFSDLNSCIQLSQGEWECIGKDILFKAKRIS